MQEGRKRVLRAIEREKKKLDDSLKRYLPEKRKKALKIRKRIEAKFGEAKNTTGWYGQGTEVGGELPFRYL